MAEVKDNLVKGGEEIIQLSFRRTTKGVSVSVKAHPLIEQYFIDNSKGEQTVRVSEYGRVWISETPLSVHYMDISPTPSVSAGISYSFSAVGKNLIQVDGRTQTVNLSILRLVGISEGIGVKFEIRQVFSHEAIQSLAQSFIKATRQFYIDHIKPFDVTVSLVTQEN